MNLAVSVTEPASNRWKISQLNSTLRCEQLDARELRGKAWVKRLLADARGLDRTHVMHESRHEAALSIWMSR